MSEKKGKILTQPTLFKSAHYLLRNKYGFESLLYYYYLSIQLDF